VDSITQMVLGAACGEVVLGKKIGNKALVWGAVAGTIPDLDVMANFFMGELDSLAFHRGPMHSLIFACLMPFLLSWLVLKFYKSGIYNNNYYKRISFVLASLLFVVIAGILSFLVIYLVHWIGIFVPILLSIGLYFLIKTIYINYLCKKQDAPTASYFEWTGLFFLSIVTHPLLDALTTFGTQLFWPFSNYRVAISNIAILDPIYTLPFLGTVIACGFFDKSDRRRSQINWIGICVSSAYMMGTLITKNHVDQVMKMSLEKQQIQVDKSMSCPTILNNILWFAIAKKDTSYYCGYYSIFDKVAKIDSIYRIDQNKKLLDPYIHQKSLQILTWFSDDYYSAMDMGEDKIQYNDLRYGTFSFRFDRPKDYIFHFNLIKKGSEIQVSSERDRPVQSRAELIQFWNRIKGY